ncbi:hypothetical protein [Deinococcus puniceus]|uniref:Cytochrome c domain-containing protein n=1 Tax=Deinococcus puniceus TaxID=1182568 RepID=A0A172T6A6_9DEIO|nr:hypothetical protein [Deinococcus puniceus]ANE42569.1 hypothetical protein SU48_00980 [Deinococcus puniceus]
MGVGLKLTEKHVLGGLIALLVLAAPAALALPKYRLQAINQFHLDDGSGLAALDRRVMSCSYCHVKESGGAPWNPFGEAIQATFKANAEAGGKAKFPEILFTLLESGGDADGDTYPDALEVWAKTLPGDAASKPDGVLETVQAEFEAVGGAEQFMPRGK